MINITFIEMLGIYSYYKNNHIQFEMKYFNLQNIQDCLLKGLLYAHIEIWNLICRVLYLQLLTE
jgi:hypothetical protein